MSNLSIKPNNLSQTKSVSKYARKFVKNLGNPDAYLPVILLEASVTLGRTYQAYQRGGFIEARERGTEETTGAVFWLGGVYAFNKMGDKIGKKLLKLPTSDFEVGHDNVRNPIKNFMKQYPKYSKKALATFKFTKIITSIVLADAFIGLVVPKINQGITKRYQKSIKEKEKNQKNQNQLNNAKAVDKKNTSFSGFMNADKLFTLTQNFENDAKYKLISTDAGIVGGRSMNARNKYERREILFRDIVSIYFYCFCKNNINSLLNYIENGRKTRLDAVSSKSLDNHMKSSLDENKNYSAQEFRKLMLGDSEIEIPKGLDSKFSSEGIIGLEDFVKHHGNSDKALIERAKAMSQLQPQLEGRSILTRDQVKDVYRNAILDNPEFLNNVYKEHTANKSVSEFKFVAEKDLRELKQQMADYVGDIIKKAERTGKEINFKTLTKACRGNLVKNSVNLGAGFVVSALFLSTFIPKIQYWMTRKFTGENKFPGVEEYKK